MNKTKKLNRIISAIIALSITVSITGCSAATEKKLPETITETTTTALSVTIDTEATTDEEQKPIENAQDEQADEAEIIAENDALTQEIYALLNEETTFEYKGVTYTIDEGYDYADSMFGTDDYYPMYDAIRDALVAKSTEVGELCLRRVKVQNRYAQLYGYDNYWDYAIKEIYKYDESMPKIIELIPEKMPRLTNFLVSATYLDPNKISADFLNEYDFMKFAAECYGNMDPEFCTQLEELMNSNRLHLNASLEPGIYGSVSYCENEKPVVSFAKQTDASFAVTSVHEFGHYLNSISAGQFNEYNRMNIFEIHSIGGVMLQLEELKNEFTALTGNSADASYLTLCYIWGQLSIIVNGIVEYHFLPDIYAHPENYTGESLAERFLEINDELGFDAGWSPEYRIITGAQWTDRKDMLSQPAYGMSYSLAAVNAIWLLYQQETNGTGREIYTKLLKSPVTDAPYVEYCTSMGLPDFTDPASYEGLDDFISEKINALLYEVYGE
ncbi:MAG: hypothetical protein ACI4J7_11015 [Ruminiclostridium sp.]